MKDKLILKDGTEIELESGASLGGISVLFPNMQAMVDAWSLMTPDNLSEVSIHNSDGVTVGQYENLVLESETSKVQEGGTILTSFHLRTKTEIELLRERVEQLEIGQDVQDGAIGELGEVVGELAEEGGLL